MIASEQDNTTHENKTDSNVGSHKVAVDPDQTAPEEALFAFYQ